MKTSVCKVFTFDAAHSLPGYPGKCSNVHGHHWVLEVEISGPVSEETGMVVDFAQLKTVVNTEVVEVLDHTLLNMNIENPTCENLLNWIWGRLSETWLNWSQDTHLTLERLRLWETPDSYAEVTP